MKRGFTLIELMVSIVILGLLTAVAVPSYKKYVTQAGLSSAISVLESTKNDLISDFTIGGSWPATLKTQGIDIPAGSGVEYLDTKVDTLFYDRDLANNVAWIGIFVSEEVGSGIPGFNKVSSPGATSGASAARVVMGFKLDARDAVITYCGQFSSDGTDVPKDYLPNGCAFEDIYSTQLSSS